MLSVLSHVMPMYMEKNYKSTMMFACICTDFEKSTRTLRETQKKRVGIRRMQKAFIAELQPFFPIPFFEYEEELNLVKVRPSDLAWHEVGRCFLLRWKDFDANKMGGSWKNMEGIVIVKHDGHDKLMLDTSELPYVPHLPRQTLLITVLNHKDALVYSLPAT